MPALRKIDPLPTHELAIRLFYLYDHFRREPVVDSFPDATQVHHPRHSLHVLLCPHYSLHLLECHVMPGPFHSLLPWQQHTEPV